MIFKKIAQNYARQNFVRNLSCNLNYCEDYFIKEIVVKYNKEKKYFYEEEYVFSDKKKIHLDLNNNFCKTCKGFGWITVNKYKNNSLTNQIEYRLCPDCN